MKTRFFDESVTEKVRSMCRYIQSDSRISDYTGMVEDQVRQIRRTLTVGQGRGRPPMNLEAKCNVILGTGRDDEWRYKANAVEGSYQLAKRINEVFRRAA